MLVSLEVAGVVVPLYVIEVILVYAVLKPQLFVQIVGLVLFSNTFLSWNALIISQTIFVLISPNVDPLVISVP